MPSLYQVNTRRDVAFLMLSGLFPGSMALLNVLGPSRFLGLGQIRPFLIVAAVSSLPYAITFLCTDVISEIWGERRPTAMVRVGLLVNLRILLIGWLGVCWRGVSRLTPPRACRLWMRQAESPSFLNCDG